MNVQTQDQPITQTYVTDRIPDAAEYFDFTQRRFVGKTHRTVQQIPAIEAFKSWELWVAQALTALSKLHAAGLLHGSITPAALIVNEKGDLRLGGLQTVHEEGTVGAAEPFNPNTLYLPPEQNLYAAFQQSVPFNTAFQSLGQANWSMDQLETIFPTIQFTRPLMFGLYERIQSAPAYRDMQQAGDVWMLGFSLLTVYYGMLEWPYTIGTEFYQTKHEAFHDLIEKMVRVNPTNRVSAEEALKEWAPWAIQPHAIVANKADNQVAPEAPEAPVATFEVSDFNVAATDDASDASQTALQPSQTALQPSQTAGGAPVRRRPYLTLQSHPAGRSKTRRNLRS